MFQDGQILCWFSGEQEALDVLIAHLYHMAGGLWCREPMKHGSHSHQLDDDSLDSKILFISPDKNKTTTTIVESILK